MKKWLDVRKNYLEILTMVKSDDWFPKGVIKLEDAALEVVKDVTNCLVIAGPGAGKTELLAQKLDYLFSRSL